MKFAVAVVSPPGYPHSEAFHEVAETLHSGLRSLGHDSILTNRVAVADRRTIVLGSNLLTTRPPPNTILYNLEQVDEASSWITPELLALFQRFTVWDFSLANVARLRAREVRNATYVPIGYVPELTRIVPAALADIDVLFYGSINERRSAILQRLRAAGLRVEVLFGLYGPARDAYVARSKVVLNLHYYEAKIFEIVRVSYLLANRCAVVSERGSDPGEERDFEGGIAFAAYDELVEQCARLAADDRARRRLGERGFEVFSARNEAEILRRALSAPP